jgi:hypothetical protein
MRAADVQLEPAGYVMAAFPGGQANCAGEMASAPAALPESNTMRALDLLLFTEDVGGSADQLSCARPATARSASSPACLGTWNRIGDGSRAKRSMLTPPFGIHQA